jgi:hypothetical protein
MYPEEIEKYKNCVPPSIENNKKGKQICPALCDFMECNYKCNDKKLNDEYYDTKKETYKRLDVKEIDMSTFNDTLNKTEINNVKMKLKDMYRFKHVYMYNEMLDIIKYSYTDRQAELFDDYFLDKALEDMMPKTENDYNNFKDTIYDKYNRPGYLIQRGKYYIFQPFDDNEDIPLYYRVNVVLPIDNLTPVKNYIKLKYGDIKESRDIKEISDVVTHNDYDFNSVMDYYEKRNENFIVGIVSINNNRHNTDSIDIFKIRPPLNKSVNKKRGTGIYSMTGAVCATSKEKDYLLNVIKKLKMHKTDILHDLEMAKGLVTRTYICNYIMLLEKYSTSKDNNKITYMMIPANHPLYQFPYNLEDRVKYIMKKVNNIVNRDIDVSIKKDKTGRFEQITHLPSYVIEIKTNKYIDSSIKELTKLGFASVGKTLTLTVD